MMLRLPSVFPLPISTRMNLLLVNHEDDDISSPQVVRRQREWVLWFIFQHLWIEKPNSLLSNFSLQILNCIIRSKDSLGLYREQFHKPVGWQINPPPHICAASPWRPLMGLVVPPLSLGFSLVRFYFIYLINSIFSLERTSLFYFSSNN